MPHLVLVPVSVILGIFIGWLLNLLFGIQSYFHELCHTVFIYIFAMLNPNIEFSNARCTIRVDTVHNGKFVSSHGYTSSEYFRVLSDKISDSTDTRIDRLQIRVIAFAGAPLNVLLWIVVGGLFFVMSCAQSLYSLPYGLIGGSALAFGFTELCAQLFPYDGDTSKTDWHIFCCPRDFKYKG